MKKNIFLMALCLLAFSCTSETNDQDVTQSLDSKLLLSKVDSYYQDISKLASLSDFCRVATRVNSAFQEITPNEQVAINAAIHAASTASAELFTNIGLTQEDLASYKEEDIALAGLLLSRELSREGISGSSNDVIDCIGRATLGISVSEWGLAGRLTAKMGLQLLKQVARKALGPIAIGFIMYDLASCLSSMPQSAPTSTSAPVIDIIPTVDTPNPKKEPIHKFVP